MNCKYIYMISLSIAAHALDTVITEGGKQLYDEYINGKLPQHISQQTNCHLKHTLSPYTDIPPLESNPEEEGGATERTIIDSYSPRKMQTMNTRMTVNKDSIVSKPSTSEKYRSTIEPFQTIQERPMTIQTSRRQPEIKLIERRLTSSGGNRVVIRERMNRNKAVNKSMIKVEGSSQVVTDEFETVRLTLDTRRKERSVREKHEGSLAKECVTQRERLERKYQAVQKLWASKLMHNMAVGNYETDGKGNILTSTNASVVPPSHPVLNLTFEPKEQQVVPHKQCQQSGVTFHKRLSFTSRLTKRRATIDPSDFSNNGIRQVSTIPFLALGHGITLCEQGLQAIASRSRPETQMKKNQFHDEFRSHIPSVDMQFCKHTVQSKSIDFNSTREMTESILWRRVSGEGRRRITVINKEKMQSEIMMA